MITRTKKGLSTVDFPKDYVVIDIETTGLNPVTDAIIELAAVKVSNDRVVDEFSSLVNPGREVDVFITNLTGITNSMLSSSEKINVVLPRFLEFVGDSHLVGHNVNFDVNFIYDNCLMVVHKPWKNNFTDTLKLSRRILNQLPHHRLEDLAKYYEVSYSGAHRALVDCRITQKCFQGLHEDATEKYQTLQAFKEAFKTSPSQMDEELFLRRLF